MKQTTRIMIYAIILGALALSAVGVAFGREITQLKLFTPPQEELEFTGVLESIEGDQWTVAGVTFSVPPSAEIKGTVMIGQLVRVHVIVNEDGSMTLREIGPATEGSLENENLNDNMVDDNLNDNIVDDNLNDNMVDDNLNDNMVDDNLNDNIGDDNANDNSDDGQGNNNRNSNDNDDDRGNANRNSNDNRNDNDNSNDNDDHRGNSNDNDD